MTQQETTSRELAPTEALALEVRSDRVRQQIEAALPEGMSVHRFVRAASTALLEADDKLLRADRRSLFTAIVKAATDGLVPDGREAALVPYKGRVQYLPMIGGLRKIAAEYGWSLRAEVVREGDSFAYTKGDEPSVSHSPARVADAGALTHAYAVARHRDGRIERLVLTKAEVEKARKVSQNPNAGPWVEWEEAMWRKTAGKALFKQLPLADADRERIERVLRADELEPGEAERLVYGEERKTPAEVLPPAEEPGLSSDPAPATEEPAEPGQTPSEAGSPLFEGEEPEAAGVRAELLALELSDEFTAYAGKTIADVVEAGDERYLRWLATEVKDDSIREAAQAGLEALES